MNLKDYLWGIFLRIMKRWSRSGLLAEAERVIAKFPKPKVLSVGGFGPIDSQLKTFVNNLGGEYITFDIDEKHGPDILGDITQISSYLTAREIYPDIIVALEVLEHVPRFDEALHSCRYALRQGGVLIFSTPWIIPIHDRPHDYFRFTPQAIAFHLSEFRSTEILARGNYRDSVVALMLRGLFSGGWSGKIFLIIGAAASLILPLPKVTSDLEGTDSCIGYISIGYK